MKKSSYFPKLVFFFFFVGREDIFRLYFFQDCSMKSYLILDMIFPPNFELSRIALCKKKIRLTSNSEHERDLFFLGISGAVVLVPSGRFSLGTRLMAWPVSIPNRYFLGKY